MNTFDDDTLVALLDYPGAPTPIDIGLIIRAGRRRRHRRQSVVAGAGVLTLAAAGIGTVVASENSDRSPSVGSQIVAAPHDSASSTTRTLPATVSQSNNLLSDHPPADGSTTTLVSNGDGWRAVAYVDVAGDICFGSVEASGTSQGACSPTDAFGNGPLVDNASGPGVSAAATAPASEAPKSNEIGVFGLVTTGESEPANFQHVARVVITTTNTSTTATLSPTALTMGSTEPLAGDERAWFAWVPADPPNGALRLSSYTANGELTGSQPLWLTPRDFADRAGS
jgi:hypothetical protein